MSSNESRPCIKDQTTGHCYHIVDKKTTWAQAFHICMQDGGMLVIIELSEEPKFIEGEPNNEPLIENCAEINTSDSSWNDCDCTYRRGHICENKHPGTSESQIWVIGVAVASALVLCMGIILLCSLIHKRQKSKKKKRDEVYQEAQEMEINNIDHAYDQTGDISDTYCAIDGDSVSPDEAHRKAIY